MPDGDAHDVDLPEPTDGDLEDADPVDADDDPPVADGEAPDRGADAAARGDSDDPSWRDEGLDALLARAAPPSGPGGADPPGAVPDAAGEPVATWAGEPVATWADEASWTDVVGDSPLGLASMADSDASGASSGWGGEGGWETLAGTGPESPDAGAAAAFEALVAGADDEAIAAAYAGEMREAIEDALADGVPPDPEAAAPSHAGGALPFGIAFGAIGGAWAAPPPSSGVGFGTAPTRVIAPGGDPTAAGAASALYVAALGPDAFAAACGADHGGSPWWGPRRSRAEDAQDDARAHAVAWPGHGT